MFLAYSDMAILPKQYIHNFDFLSSFYFLLSQNKKGQGDFVFNMPILRIGNVLQHPDLFKANMCDQHKHCTYICGPKSITLHVVSYGIRCNNSDIEIIQREVTVLSTGDRLNNEGILHVTWLMLFIAQA